MPRLPELGKDAGEWGAILNDFLSVEHNTDGTLKKATDITTAKTTADQALSAATAAYTKPNTGIPTTDLSSSVQTSLTKADTALQTPSTLTDRGAWTAATTYAVNDVIQITVSGQPRRYVARTTHTASTAFATDAANWVGLDADMTGTYAPFQLATQMLSGRRWLMTGDSITQYAGAGSRGWAYLLPSLVGTSNMNNSAQAAVLSANNYNPSVVAGIGGQTSTQILARLPSDLTVSGMPFSGVAVLAGTNDTDYALWQSNIIAMAAICRARGIPLVVGTVPPTYQISSTRRRAIMAQNVWLNFWGPRAGVSIAQVWNALADPATADMKSIYNGDGIHPNGLGQYQIGLAFADVVKPLYGSVDQGFVLNAINSIQVNPLMTGTVGVGLPTSWSAYFDGTGTAATYSTAGASADPILPAGQWLTATVDTTGGTASGRRIISGASSFGIGTNSYTAGGVGLLVGVISHTDIAGYTASSIAGSSGIGVSVVNGGNTEIYAAGGVGQGTNFMCVPFLFPAAGKSLLIKISLTTAAGIQVVYRVGCLGIIDLSAMQSSIDYAKVS